MIPVLRPLVSPNNTITAFPGNNTLIITDYAANLKRLSKVIATLDSPRLAAKVQIVVIKNLRWSIRSYSPTGYSMWM